MKIKEKGRVLRLVALSLSCLMILSLFAGCKDKNKGNSDNTTSDNGPTNTSNVVEVDDTPRGYPEGVEPYETRILPVGLLPEVDNTYTRYDVYTQDIQEITKEDGHNMLLIPLGSVPAYTMIHTAVLVDGINYSILAWYDYTGEVYVAYDLSRWCTPTAEDTYNIMLYDGVRRLLCRRCGQVFDLSIMGVRRDLDSETCRPWTFYREEWYEVTDVDSEIFWTERYPWIDSSQSGEYIYNVPYVTPEYAADNLIIGLDHDTLVNGLYELYDASGAWD